MEKRNINITVTKYSYEELDLTVQELISAAKKAAQEKAYAPYSRFKVGTAVRLDDNTIETGSNQENAAYPSGLCAERVTIFHANSEHPGKAIKMLAIAAIDENGNFTEDPISPCGSCRQVMIETEKRYNQKIKTILYGTKEIFAVDSAQTLLPLSFCDENMGKKGKTT